MWESIGAKVNVLTPSEHDRILSLTSHIPHIISWSYISLFKKIEKTYIAGSFKDLTRIALSPSTIWKDIFITNKKYILKDIDRLMKALEKFKKYISKEDERNIIHFIESAKRKKIELDEKNN